MTERHGDGKVRHRRRKTALAAGVPLAPAAAGAMAYGTAFGVFGEDARPKTAAAPRRTWADDTADGFASVHALGQKGTYGGRGGKTVTVRTLADLEKYATAQEPYVIVVAAIVAQPVPGHVTQVVSLRLFIENQQQDVRHRLDGEHDRQPDDPPQLVP